MPENLATRPGTELPLARAIDTLAAAAYVTDAAGRIRRYNRAAADLWGREPRLNDEYWCGSLRLFYLDGSPMPQGECPMARALKSGHPIAGEEAILERPDGSRINFLAYPTPLQDESGTIVGALNLLIDVTDLKRAEKALQSREAELSDLIENTTIGLHWVGPDGTVLWANRAEMEFLGLTPDEYIGHHIAEVHADPVTVDDILTRLARSETLKDYEARLRCKDGSIKHVLIDSSVYKEDGRFVHTRCFTRDVTKQRKTEERLAVSAEISQILSESKSLDDAAPRVLERLGDHFEADIVALWLGDEKLRCVIVQSRLPGDLINKFRKASEGLSLAPGEGLPGRAWQSREPVWRDWSSAEAGFAPRGLAAELGLATAFAIPVLFGQESLGAITCLMRRSLPSDPSLVAMMTSVGHKLGQFIERVRGEESNRYLAAVVRASTDAIITATDEGDIISWNVGAQQLYGYTAEEAIGQPMSLVVPPDKLDERNRSVAKLKRGEHVTPFETIRLARGGVRIPVSLSFSAVHDPDGNFVGAAVIARDISEQKAAEAQLEARIRQLDDVSALGMSALASDDLRPLFDEAVTRLADGLSVELTKVLELQPGGRDLLLRAGIGWRKGLVGQATVGAGLDSQAGYTLEVDEPVVVENLDSETRFSGPGLLVDHGVVSGLSTVIRGENGKPFGVLGAHTRSSRRFSAHDVHFIQSVANILAGAVQGRNYRSRQEMLLQELSHRVKNMLSVIQAMASQTGRNTASMDEFARSFGGRLSALARAHELLTESSWTGASIRQVADFVIGGQVEMSRLRIDLDDVKLDAAATQALAMVFHELTTNAIKYGALSGNDGTVTLRGCRTDEADRQVYRLGWRETGGPPVQKNARRDGFGSRLIAGTVSHRFGGEAAMDWRREGLAVDLTLPLATITAR